MARFLGDDTRSQPLPELRRTGPAARRRLRDLRRRSRSEALGHRTVAAPAHRVLVRGDLLRPARLGDDVRDRGHRRLPAAAVPMTRPGDTGVCGSDAPPLIGDVLTGTGLT